MLTLAKKLKIKNIKLQRDFIEKNLRYLLTHPNENGDTSFRYLGEVYPEVVSYFTTNGFRVERLSSDVLTALTKGLPLYRFTVDKNVDLSPAEVQAAEEVEYHFVEDACQDSLEDSCSDSLEEALAKLFKDWIYVKFLDTFFYEFIYFFQASLEQLI